MKKELLILVVVALALLASQPALAVTDGELDGDGHPYVGLMVGQAGGVPLFRCSGALLSPTIFLTAGHCTFGIDHVEIWFDADVESGIPGNGYPFTGDIGGTPHTHPLYIDAAFFLFDLGVVVLDEPGIEMDEYAVLPDLDELDVMATQRGLQDVTFTSVGYGLQRINPVFVEAERVRMFARPHLIMINVPGFTGDFSIMLSNNHSTGGTCFGDSGGPNFIDETNVVGGVTSFGLNGNCAGTGGVYRVDRADDLTWLMTTFGDQIP